ncbi:hypothetical protein [Ewingella americana]|uniref:Uncharacterized protein n=1 Tax=Ewingella americana TaxID=41202 RepID=A0A502GCP6_9GAMM|nr:hypothetical protein [Ewingella americana]TPG60047.1 hypothetical protein EAH77_15890 [Ewingella americana]
MNKSDKITQELKEEQKQHFKLALAIKPLNTYPVQGMTQEQTQLFLQFSAMPEEVPEELLTILKSVRLFQLAHTRCAVASMVVHPLVLAFIVDCLSDGNPGIVTLYIHAIQMYMSKNNLSEFTWECMYKLFPMGFPSRETCELAWRDQKIDGHNGVDIVLGYKPTSGN